MNIKKQSGFTIVELLIVIVVIGILAALVLNSFASAQVKARDTKRRDDLTAISKALQTWSINNQKPISQLGGGAANGKGYGWFDYSMTTTPNSGDYVSSSIKDVIVSSNLISTTVGDPQYVKGTTDYCLWMSNDNTQWGVFAKLEAPTTNDASIMSNLQASGAWSNALGTSACSSTRFNHARTFVVPS